MYSEASVSSKALSNHAVKVSGLYLIISSFSLVFFSFPLCWTILTCYAILDTTGYPFIYYTMAKADRFTWQKMHGTWKPLLHLNLLLDRNFCLRNFLCSLQFFFCVSGKLAQHNAPGKTLINYEKILRTCHMFL